MGADHVRAGVVDPACNIGQNSQNNHHHIVSYSLAFGHGMLLLLGSRSNLLLMPSHPNLLASGPWTKGAIRVYFPPRRTQTVCASASRLLCDCGTWLKQNGT